MSNTAEIFSQETISHFGPGRVVADAGAGGIVSVQLSTYQGNKQVQARVAIPLAHALSAGDEVLTAGDDIHNMYIIGLLSQKGTSKDVSGRLDIGSGAYLTIDGTARKPVLQVFSKRNELVLEYEPESERTRINVEQGNLEFSARDGDIILDSSQTIRLNGEVIDVTAKSGAHISVRDAVGQLVSSLSLRRNLMKLDSPQLGIAAHRADFRVSDGRYLGTSFSARLKESRLIVGKLTTIARSVTEKAVNVYRSVEQLAQQKAGRMRTMVSSTYHVKAENAYMKSDRDFKINADKIHLG